MAVLPESGSASATRTWPHFHANVEGGVLQVDGGRGGGAVVFLCEPRHKSSMLSGLKTKNSMSQVGLL